MPFALEAAAPAADDTGVDDGEATPAAKKPKLRKFDAVVYTGGKMKLPSLPHPVVVDISGMRVTKSTPVLKNHDLNQPVGHAEDVTLGNSIRAKGILSAATDHAREVSESADNKFPWQASIGAQPTEMLFMGSGEKFQANGRQFVGPAYFAKKSVLREISVTPVGADESSSTKVAASAIASPEVLSMLKFDEWLKAKGFDAATISETQKTFLQASYDAELKASTAPKPEPAPKPAAKPAAEDAVVDPVQALKDLRASYAAELGRVEKIHTLAKGHPAIEAKAVAEGWDETRVELAVLRASRPTGPAIHVAGQPSDALPMAIVAAMCLSNGMREENAKKHFDEKTLNAAMSRQLRGVGLSFLFHTVIRAAGHYAQPGAMSNDTIRAAFAADQALQATFPSQDMIYAAGELSTVSLSGILSNVANKLLLDSFSAVPIAGPQICGVRDAVDFKPTFTYRLTESGEFALVGPDGELKHGTLSDESYQNQVQTRGKIIALTRQQIISDDLGAFLQIPKLLGRASALAFERAVFTLLLSNPNSYDGNALFSAAHKNYQSGGTTELDIDPLTAAETLFLDQVDSAGEPIVCAPSILLVPTALKTYADQLYKQTVVVGVPVNNKLKPANNPHAGKWRVVSSPFLNAQNISGSSATAWYLLADPADIAVIEACYLRGTRTPIIESAETNFNILGMQWRGFFDFGIGLQDWRGGVMSAGA